MVVNTGGVGDCARIEGGERTGRSQRRGIVVLRHWKFCQDASCETLDSSLAEADQYLLRADLLFTKDGNAGLRIPY